MTEMYFCNGRRGCKIKECMQENSSSHEIGGDTLSVESTDANLDFRLDLRVLVQTEKGRIEAATGEIASCKTTIRSKLYGDKLQSVLASKCHFNHLISKLRSIRPHKLKTIYIPIVQIMGLSCTVHALSLADKQLYFVQNVLAFEFRRTYHELQANGIGKILNGFRELRVFFLTKQEEKALWLTFIFRLCSTWCHQ